ncbi:NADH-quinone oxidoreductase subunit NuoF [Carpediemonas membranifera]|uniref:NADH-quinone oxidoreductase subunit NuoF n=1 Tax=Carpediemonas membranifera TaxID=201153 RepID=A0A8J6AX05_9EUKA|nr:NADH-quinone oxidoreductase subunit NuoF [Carpediemonas membranifera]|eukprot:KAG9393645.1 NADH-quinone oxidoreductase subunit NuoF [Carpediemonas membranifera]
MLSTFAAKSFGQRGYLAAADHIFTNLYGQKTPTIENAKKAGDFKSLGAILAGGDNMRDEILNTMQKAGQRGRGGAGFDTGAKWSFLPRDDGKQHYLVVNADEGEPGTSKDRYILRNEPYKLIEGMIYSAFTIKATQAYIYIRGEFKEEQRAMQKAIDEAYKAGLLGPRAQYPLDVHIHSGAGAYVCGEETALLNSIEGKPGKPRHKPPYPATQGLFMKPTIINNVETIAQVPAILTRGLEWWTSLGTPANHGTKLYTISGAVNKPCTVEDAMGVTIGELIDEHAGGPTGGWENVQAIIPGGSSTLALTPEEARTAKMDFDSLRELGTEMGTGGIIVIPKDVDFVDVTARMARFYAVESCGQCQPCKLGTHQMATTMAKIKAGTATQKDADRLKRLTKIHGLTICALAGAACQPIKGLLGPFRESLDSKLVE